MDWFRLTAHALVLALATCAAARAAARVNVLGDNVQLSCTQPSTVSLACDFRLLDPAPVENVSAQIHNIALAPPDRSLGNPAFNEFLIYFLVDTSDTIGQPTMAAMRRHIQSLVDSAAAYHRFGLAAFSNEIQELVKPGSSGESIRTATPKLPVSGHTSELYRNVLQAVRALSVSPADRKALFVLSDGLADDQAYFHEDVIGAAQAGGVIIVGLGYARSEHDSVALQAVRRLAEDSGGIYLAAGENVDLPPGFAEDVYRILGNGGGFTFDLSPAVEQGLSGTRSLLVQLTLENGSASASIPVHIPSSLPPSPNVTTVVEKKQVPTPAPAGVLVKPDNLFLWIAVGLLAMVVIVMLFVLVFLLRRNTPAGTTIEQTAEPKSEESEGNREPEITVAYLEPLDDVGTAYTINCATYRIGRHSSNDLPVPDSSVSRQHAEIRRRGGGEIQHYRP